MTARMIELEHENQEDSFHCPLTGAKIFDAMDLTFDHRSSPYFLFLMTAEGKLFARTDELPEAHAAALDRSIARLTDATLSAHEMDTFMPNVIAVEWPESVLLFELRSPKARNAGLPSSWVALDFGLP